jgi:uncharacterized membrane protein YccC
LSKKKARELSVEDMNQEGVVWGEELRMDMYQLGTQALSEAEKEAVDKAREGLWALLDVMTASTPPEPTVQHLEYVHKMCRTALFFRNTVRGTFLKAQGHELPEKWERIGGSVH